MRVMRSEFLSRDTSVAYKTLRNCLTYNKPVSLDWAT